MYKNNQPTIAEQIFAINIITNVIKYLYLLIIYKSNMIQWLL